MHLPARKKREGGRRRREEDDRGQKKKKKRGAAGPMCQAAGRMDLAPPHTLEKATDRASSGSVRDVTKATF